MYFKYLKYVLKHKYYVFTECCRLGVPLRGLLHDLSKLSWSEFKPYAQYFNGVWMSEAEWHGDIRNHVPYKYTQMYIDKQFDIAWLKHQNRNKHHYQYWLLNNDSPSMNVTISENVFTDYEFNQWYVIYVDGEPKFKTCDDDKKLCEQAVRLLRKPPVLCEMPTKYVKEMVADWAGAGKAITGKLDVCGWYDKNKKDIMIHPNTREMVESLLEEYYGYEK